MGSLTRAQFLRGDWSGSKPDLKPPWALPEPAFSEACDGCGDCVAACAQNIISITARKRPTLDFSSTGCTFCGDCVTACEPGALQRTLDGADSPWGITAQVARNCLATNGTACVRCVEECTEEAIIARPAPGGRTSMQINDDACTGCGMCVGVCPVDALSLATRDAPVGGAGALA
jgi:ferredoxin-type protein NapF